MPGPSGHDYRAWLVTVAKRAPAMVNSILAAIDEFWLNLVVVSAGRSSGRGVRWACRPGQVLMPWRRGSMSPAADTVEAMVPEPRSEERAVRSKFMLIFRGGAVARHDLSPSELQAHVEKWYRWSDELARQGRGNGGTALDNPGATVRGRERVVTDGPYAESKDLVTGSLIIEAASLDDAVDVARTCPTFEFGGSVEVRLVQDHRI
jgi:hypothetical protein